MYVYTTNMEKKNILKEIQCCTEYDLFQQNSKYCIIWYILFYWVV